MGTFRYRIEIAVTPEGPFEALDALVDTGATYTMAPRSLLERLHVVPVERRTFIMADGSPTERDVGVAFVRLDGRIRPSTVVVGQEAATPLLGAVTLEELGLGVDPVRKTLMPVPGYLVGMPQEDANDS